MSELQSDLVHRGIWIDLSKGSLMGKTITTDAKTGTIIIALLAVLSSMATTHLWNLFTFIVHQVRATGHPADGLYRQQQALLCTSPQPSSVMADHIKLWWFWRRKTDRAFMRSIFHFVIAFAFFLGALAASVFSSSVISGSTIQVLVNSKACGYFSLGTDEIWEVALDGYWKRLEPASRRLTEECYLNNGSLPTICNMLAKPKISMTREWVPCPFSPAMCEGGILPTVSLDSGLLDLNEAFGLNLPASDQVQFRKRTTCSVLPLDGHTAIVNASELPSLDTPYLPGAQFLLLHYGISKDLTIEDWPNATFIVNLAKVNASEDYAVRVASDEFFNPINGMKTTDAGLLLVMVTKNTVSYRHPIDDPVFSAHKAIKYRTYTYPNDTEYASDEPLSVLGCTEQYQFCTAQESCTKLGRLPNRGWADTHPDATDLQRAVLKHLININSVFHLLNIRNLRASSQLRSGLGTSLPNDQWVNEVIGWESSIWAQLQIAIPDYAIGLASRYPVSDAYIQPPSTPAQKQLCGMQKMPKSGGFVNINVFGFSFIIAFASLVTILDMTLLKFLIHLGKFRRVLSPRLDRWIQDGVLQLQRRAYEAQGQGTWEHLDDEIPVTETKELLTELPVAALPTLDSVFWRHKLQKSATFHSLMTQDGSLKDEVVNTRPRSM
ncbi:hypothetical protein CC78DRAFT_617092 [Lojkania enalia]|uniref:Uncharacterized protein n=1 Tax=Lojkania enalia TaxID=147567 RepID=A0A9P4K8J4_9PLEO|nr:hypothetical protein CC78DRAFT_617092 [Didymosphaeria enalia]